MSVRAERTISLLVPLDVDEETMEGFYAELDGRLRESPGEILLDCSLLEHASSTHINTLWQARDRCEEAEIKVRLTEVTYGLARVLEVLDLYDLFTAERDGVEARKGVGRPDLNASASPAFSIDVNPTVDGISGAMQDLHDYLVRLNLGEIFAFDLETVFYEVTTNIRLHGDLREGEYIKLTAVPRNGFFHLRFEDTGPHFDPTSRTTDFDPKRAMRKRQRRGFGLAMIKKLVDRLSYERQDDRVNILSLEKRITANGGHL